MLKWTVYITTETIEEVTVEAESQLEALQAAEASESKKVIRASRKAHTHEPEAESVS